MGTISWGSLGNIIDFQVQVLLEPLTGVVVDDVISVKVTDENLNVIVKDEEFTGFVIDESLNVRINDESIIAKITSCE